MKRSRLTLTLHLSAAITGLWLADKCSAQPAQDAPKQEGSVVVAVTNAAPGDANVLGDEKSRASYALGMNYGHAFRQQGIDLDWGLFSRGFKDAQSGGAMLLTPQEMSATLEEFRKTLIAKQQLLAAQNEADGDAFLATNRNNPGVITRGDGLQYKVMNTGSGIEIAPDDVVTLNYRGTFIDGTEFDSSARGGKPAQIQVDRANIPPGLNEALKLMKFGSKWQVFIPSQLAYGTNGRPGIPPNEVLIYEIEILAIEHPQPPPPPPPPANPPLTSDIIKVPSAEEMKKGAKVEIIKSEDAQKQQPQQSPPAH